MRRFAMRRWRRLFKENEASKGERERARFEFGAGLRRASSRARELELNGETRRGGVLRSRFRELSENGGGTAGG